MHCGARNAQGNYPDGRGVSAARLLTCLLTPARQVLTEKRPRADPFDFPLALRASLFRVLLLLREFVLSRPEPALLAQSSFLGVAALWCGN